MTDKEKALKIIAKQIKDLDNNTIGLAILNSSLEIGSARANYINILSKHGYELSTNYKLIAKK